MHGRNWPPMNEWTTHTLTLLQIIPAKNPCASWFAQIRRRRCEFVLNVIYDHNVRPSSHSTVTIKISSRPIFDAENDDVVWRSRYLAPLDVSVAISKASIFGRFSSRRQISSTSHSNNRFLTTQDHYLHYIDIYGRWGLSWSYWYEHKNRV